MMDREKLRDELIRDEGVRLLAYRDSVGLWTIGIGHLLGPRQRMIEITRAEADALLEGDIDEALLAAQTIFPGWRMLDDARQRALANMAFNLGARLNGFVKFRAAVSEHDWVRAAAEMMDSRWAKQVKARAARLHDMILTGTTP